MVSEIILNNMKNNDIKLKVNLTYFKDGGKYYSSGYYMSDYLPIHEIWDEVKTMKKHPGLIGVWSGLILIDVENHIHKHPHIVKV